MLGPLGQILANLTARIAALVNRFGDTSFSEILLLATEVESSEMASYPSAADRRSILAKSAATSTSWASERLSMRLRSCITLVVANPVMPIAPAVMLKGSVMYLSVWIKTVFLCLRNKNADRMVFA